MKNRIKVLEKQIETNIDESCPPVFIIPKNATEEQMKEIDAKIMRCKGKSKKDSIVVLLSDNGR